MSDPVPPFGAYALPEKREALRLRAGKYSDTKMGRWGISYARKRALKDLPDPFDVAVMPGVNARLWPRTSRCEKRAFAGVQVWDAAEHLALADALERSEGSPFVFLDVGANVGLYSLILAMRAKALGNNAKLFAIEPDPTNRARLEFNIGASGADITVLPFAISDQEQDGYMGGGKTNRGEVRLMEGGKHAVQIKTVHGICEAENITRIDAMKVDIEGHDEQALTAFFKTAPKNLWPRLLILETGRAPTTPLLELCTARGYTIIKRAGINSILTCA